MIKLFKYEVKDIYRQVFLGIVILTLLNVLVFLGYQLLGGAENSGFEIVKDEEGITGFGTKGLLGLGIIFCYLANVSMVILAVIAGINIFRKDIYGDTGTMMLTVPRSGMQIVAAKFLTALLLFVLLFELSGYFLVMHTIGLTKPLKDGQFAAAFMDATIGKLDAWIFMTIIFVVLFTWITIAAYLAISFSKSFFRNKKLRWLVTIGVFGGLIAVDTLIERLLEKYVPFTFDPTMLLKASSKMVVESIELNYAAVVFELLVMAAMFVATAYLIEKKVEV